MGLIEDSLSVLTGLTPTQRKLIGAGILALGSFWGGVTFSDFRLKAKVGSLTVTLEKTKQAVADKDVEISQHITVKEQKMKEALIAKKEADDAHVQAAKAEARYREAVDEARTLSESFSKSGTVELPAGTPATAAVDMVAKACDEVIAKKDEEIKGLNKAYGNVFDAKAAADQAIAGLQFNEVKLKSGIEISGKINSDLQKQLESQNRRKWLYFAGGIILGVATDKAIRK